MNMEDDRYTDDQLPEYLILDAFYARLTNSDLKVRFLERDFDTLAMIERERSGIDLPTTTVEVVKSEDDINQAAEDARVARERISNLISGVLGDIAAQDVIVMSEESCCGNNEGKKKLVETKIIANEVGSNKAALLKKLVNEYTALYDLKNISAEPAVTTTTTVVRKKVQVDQADYLLAYRIYDFGTWSVKDKRTTYLKLHVRIVDMESGQILLSDFMEHRIEDVLTSGEKNSLVNSHASQSDFGRPAKRTSDSGK
jgi:hypothetical protein